MKQLDIGIGGMTCASCVGHVERALRKLPGLSEVDVNLSTQKAHIQGETLPSTQNLIDQIQKAGYEPLISERELTIEGMTCASCVSHVERALAQVPGVSAVSVNLATGKANLKLLAELSDDSLIDAVEAAGYSASPSTQSDQSAESAESLEGRTQREAQQLQWRFWLALLATLPVFITEMGGHLVPAFHHWIYAALGQQNLWYAQCLLSTVVLFGPGLLFFQKGIPALLRLAPDMNSLVVMGTLAAWGYSLVATFLPDAIPSLSRQVYYEAAATIVTLILLGRMLEARAKGRTSSAISQLIKLRPQTARRITPEGKEETLNLSDIKLNDKLVVRPGDKVPLDGKIIEGESYIDESMMTGEPLAVNKKIDDEVIGGTLNQSGAFTMTVTRVGNQTLLAQIIHLVESAQATKMPIQTLVDKITLWFVPAIMLAAIITLSVWWIWGPSFQFALINAVSVLIIACPCAMGLATPTSIMVATGRAATMGLLMRKGSALQTLAELKLVAFDKTGTLTKGQPELTDFIASDDCDKDELLAQVAAAEARSEHPLAKALIAELDKRTLPAVKLEKFNAIAGYGISAQVDGQQLLIGADRLFKQEGIALDAFNTQAATLAAQGKTPIFIARDNQLVAVMALADAPKPSSQAAIAALHRQGYEVAMISGDNRKTAEYIAQQMGIDRVEAEVLPEQKVAVLKKLREEFGLIGFVGDGINDAPALAEADLGMAIGTGTDIAIESAELVIVSGDLSGVAKSLALAKATMRNIKQNLFWAFGYNVALVPLAAGVAYPAFGLLLSPVVAAGAMALSSVFVVTNALRLKRLHLES